MTKINPQLLEVLDFGSSVRFIKHCKLDKKTGCWVWQLSIDRTGYGKYHNKEKTCWAHRFAYRLFKGKFRPELVLDHLCRNRICVNPNHLEEVTMKTNNLRGYGVGGINYRKTHCDNGHEFSKDNTYRYQDRRDCKTCIRLRWQTEEYKEHHKEWYQKNKERINKQHKEYKLKNKDKIEKYNKIWRIKNKEKVKISNRKYRLKNKGLK